MQQKDHLDTILDEDLILNPLSNKRSIYEYIWIDGDGNMRSKKRVTSLGATDWNFDGSSTGQATGEDSEVILKPRAKYRFVHAPGSPHWLVICDTWHRFKTIGEDGKISYSELMPALNNNRTAAAEIFDIPAVRDEHTWFGLEQEYFLQSMNISSEEYCRQVENDSEINAGNFYCGVAAKSVHHNRESDLVHEHMQICIDMGINISGVNAEVAPTQWEFQIGPCEGIDAADQLWAARFLLVKLASEYGYTVLFDPKLKGATLQSVNGSGCHTNFSTRSMRKCPTKDVSQPLPLAENPEEQQTIEQDPAAIRGNGVSEYIMTVIERLEKAHNEHMLVYGVGNDARMTGVCETAAFDQFSYGVGDRGASVRIPTDVFLNGYGYIEDRRPAANADPYLVTSIIAQTAIIG